MNKRLRISSRNAFSPTKGDVEVVWKYVQYPPTREALRQAIRDKNKIPEVIRIHREHTGSCVNSGNKKSIVGKISKDGKNKAPYSKDDLYSENEDSKDQSSVYQESIKVKEFRKKSSILKRNSSVVSKADSPRASISNLTLLFQQNRPQTFFGIRKPRTFDLVIDRETKVDSTKLSPTIDSIMGLFIKPIVDVYSQESPKKQPSRLQTLSLKFTSMNIFEIQERFSDLNKVSGKHSVNFEVFNILNTIAKEGLMEKQRLLSLSGFNKITFPDTKDKLTRERILHLFVNKHYKENHPRYKDKIKDDEEETEFEKIIMKNCVLNNKLLLRVMKNSKFYSYKLRQKMTEIDTKLNTKFEDQNEILLKFIPKITVETKLLKSKSALRKRKVTGLDDICSDCKEFNGFYRPLFEYWINDVIDSNEVVGVIEPHNIKEAVQNLGLLIGSKKNQPGTKTMFLTQQLLKSGLINTALQTELCNNVEGWLDQILKSLLSKFATIRLECFITLSYFLSKPSYIAGINSNLFNETFYDIVATILRCIDLKSEEFPLYYSLLGVIFHFAPSQIILDCLIERGPYCNEVEMIMNWPKFVYIAMKYWPSQYFNSSPIYLRRVIETLENHYLRECLSRKLIKDAITCIVKRFNVTSNMITVWPKVTETFPA